VVAVGLAAGALGALAAAGSEVGDNN
jgi:hypothetical protein